MTNCKKLLALVLALALVLSLAACGGNESSSSASGSSTASNQSESSTADDASSAEDGDESTPEESNAAAPGSVELPLTTEPVELSYWTSIDTNCAIMKTDYNDNELYQEMEKRTGVHLTFEMVAAADRQTNFNLMIASNNLTDLMYAGASYYSDGLDAAIDDGYFLDLTDKVDEYMPNYQAIRKSSPDYEMPSMTDSGRIGTVYELRQSKQGPWLGMWMRKDWLDKTQKKVPVTYDEWHDVLAAFKDQMGASAALLLNWSGSDGEIGAMSAGYGVLNNWQLDETGKVNYGPYMEGWKKYVTTMHNWYAEGLIDPDFMATDERTADMTAVITGKTGAFAALYTMPSLYESSSEDKDMYLIPVTAPKENAGDELHIRLRDSYISGNTAISAQCEHPEIAMRWLDYLFTEEGALLANYGIEGDTFEYDADGKITFTDKMLNNENGWTAAQTIASYVCPSSAIANWSDWTRELMNVPEKDQECYTVWGSHKDDWRLPSLSLTADEAVERSAIYADASSVVKEYTAKFISGALDIEAEWDNYIGLLETAGIQRAIEITQAAYDRYQAR